MKLSKRIPKRVRTLIYRILDPFYPYYISIVGEAILNTNFWKGRENEHWRAGRVEIFKDGPHNEDEFRFFTNKEEWFKFENEKDFSVYSKRGLKKLEKWIKENFHHPPEF
jgi:hypothetical protein